MKSKHSPSLLDDGFDIQPADTNTNSKASGQANTAHHSSSRTSGRRLPSVYLILGAVILAGLSFSMGMQFQKGRTTNTANAAGFNNMAGGQGQNFGSRSGSFRQRGAFGTVTAVSSTSITIEDNFRGDSQTFAISSNTKVSENGSTASVSDIKSGDRVMVQESSSDSKTASAIAINPQVPTPGGGAPGTTNDSNDTDAPSSSSSI